MSTIEELKKKRFQFLRLLYDKSGGNRFSSFNMWELSDELGFSHAEAERIADYLVGENLLEHIAIGGEITLTHYGIREVEEALSHPERPTHYFPAVNIINIHHMEGSQIQQGVIGSNQTGTFEFENSNDYIEFIKLLKSSLSDLRLKPDEESEAKADIATIEAQLSTNRPKPGILKESLLSLQRILEGAAGAIIAQQLLPYIPALLALIGK